MTSNTRPGGVPPKFKVAAARENRFWRCFASSFVRRQDAVLGDLMQTLQKLGMHRATRLGDRRQYCVGPLQGDSTCR